MAGIYIHWPFCVQKCIYCDFHSSTRVQQQDAMCSAILKELHLRKKYLPNHSIDTIYFGGGTPSLLSAKNIQNILHEISNTFEVNNQAEITLECNPDDLSLAYLENLRDIKINRLSIGIQSFNDDELLKLNRRHNARQALNAIHNIKDLGFDNISLDLIYGLPNSTLTSWSYSLETALELQVSHLSVYHLTYEPKTWLYKKKHLPSWKPLDENQSISQFELLQKKMREYDYEHYEISNFAKSGKYSKHNTSYWNGEYYLGIGPSAHSYNGSSRQWNISHNLRYMDGLNSRTKYYETELLEEKERYNESILTGLRTMWGIDLSYFETTFGSNNLTKLLGDAGAYLNSNYLIKTQTSLLISEQGKMISDQIMSDLMWI